MLLIYAHNICTLPQALSSATVVRWPVALAGWLKGRFGRDGLPLTFCFSLTLKYIVVSVHNILFQEGNFLQPM